MGVLGGKVSPYHSILQHTKTYHNIPQLGQAGASKTTLLWLTSMGVPVATKEACHHCIGLINQCLMAAIDNDQYAIVNREDSVNALSGSMLFPVCDDIESPWSDPI